MSAQISRADLEAMTKDELVDVILELAGRVDDLETRADLASKKRDLMDDEIWELRDEDDALRDRVADLEARANPDPASKSYDEKSREDKVLELRLALARKAGRRGGKAQMDYREVLALFDEHPSPGHAYDLMRDAGNLDGFEYGRFNGGERIRVNIGDVNDDAVFHAANKGSASEGVE